MTALDLLSKLPGAFVPASADGSNCVIQFSLANPAHVVIDGGNCALVQGAAPSPDLTITMEDADFVDMMTGKLNGMQAFMTGKLQIDGDLMLAQKMTKFFDPAKLA
jgi:putative sterol carrier protein